MSFIPNTTPTPNWLYNGEMKKMTETELKVVLLVTRKTLGWFDPLTGDRKNQDYISQSQFMDFTGKSNRAIATAIQSCVEKRWIIARNRQGDLCNTPEKRARRKVWYQLGSIFTSKISSEESSQDENLVNITTSSGELNDTNLVNKVHSTKETITKETLQKIASNDAKGIQKSSSKKKQKSDPMSLQDFMAYKKHWTTKPQANGAVGKKRHSPQANDDTHRRHVVPNKDTHRVRKHIEEGIATTSVAEPINQVFKIFYDTINPQINYGNRTWRKATEDLINSYGFEKVLRLTEVACAVQGQEYAPTITNPYQLKEKLASLQIFIQRSNQPKKGAIQSL